MLRENGVGGELAPSALLERVHAELRDKDAELEKKDADLEAAAKSGLTLVRENTELKSRVERLSESLRRSRRQVPHPKLSQSFSNPDLRKSDADVSDLSDASEVTADDDDDDDDEDDDDDDDDDNNDDSPGTGGGARARPGSCSPFDAPPRTPAGRAGAAGRSGHTQTARRAHCFAPPSRTPPSGRRPWMSPARFADQDVIHALELEHAELKCQLEAVVAESERAQRLARHTQKRLEARLERARADLDTALREKEEFEKENRLLARQRADFPACQHPAPGKPPAAEPVSAGCGAAGGSDAKAPSCADHNCRESAALRLLSDRVAELEMSEQSLKSAKSDAERRLMSVVEDLEAARRRVAELVVLEAEIPVLTKAYEKQQESLREVCEELEEERARNADLGKAAMSPSMSFPNIGAVEWREPNTPQRGPRANMSPQQDGDSIFNAATMPVVYPCSPGGKLTTATLRQRKMSSQTLQAEFESVRYEETRLITKPTQVEFPDPAVAVYPCSPGGNLAAPAPQRRKMSSRTLQAEFESARNEETRLTTKLTQVEYPDPPVAVVANGPGLLVQLAEEVTDVLRSEFKNYPPSSTQFSACHRPGLVGFLYRCFYGMIRYAKFLAILFCSVVYALWAGPGSAGL